MERSGRSRVAIGRVELARRARPPASSALPAPGALDGRRVVKNARFSRCYDARVMHGASGDEELVALGREALAYADTLYNLARYLTGNGADAEDLVQETYARALRAVAQFEPGTNLKAWLFRILRNTWVSDIRRRRADPTVGGLDTVSPAVDPAAATWRQDDAEMERLSKIVSEDVERALMRLSADARTVILLDLEGLSEADMAGVLGCPLGTVKSRLARARQALRYLLRDYGR